MKKIGLLSLIMACVMLATGCSLVVKDPAVDGARTVITVNGVDMNKKAFMEEYNSNLQLQRQLEELYRAYGMQAPVVSDDEIMENTIDGIVRNELLTQKAHELGLDVLSDEEKANIEEETVTRWNNILAGVKTQFFKDSELPEEELNAAVEEKALSEGYSKEQESERATKNLVMNKLREEMIKDAVVTSEEIKAEYDSFVERDKAASEADLNAYGQAKLNNQDFYYAPAGYRMVKQILVKFTQEDNSSISAAKTVLTEKQAATANAQSAFDLNAAALEEEGLSPERTQKLTDEKAKLQQQLDAAKQEEATAKKVVDDVMEQGYKNIKEKADDIYARLTAGEDFDTLAKEFNEDTGMPESGYAVRKGFTDFDYAFVGPAMELKNVGDVAEPSPGIYGYYIVQYAADVKEGPVAIESVQEDIKATLLSKRQDETYENTIKQWIENGNILIDRDIIKD